MALSEEKQLKADTTARQYWFLAAAKPKQEFRAIENLLNQHIDCFCPSIKVEKFTKNRKNIVTEALFKGYIFIHISPEDPNWHKVRSTRGVRDWIRFSSDVAKIPQSLVKDLKLFTQNGSNLLINKMKSGDSIRVLSGPFEGLEGIFQNEDGDFRAIVLIDFLGQSNRIKIDKSQLVLD